MHPNSKFLAVVNQDEESVVFDISDVFSEPGAVATTSVEVKKERWSWASKNRKPANEGRTNTGKVVGKVMPNVGLVVSYLQFSLKGLFIFYSILGQSKSISFKVVDDTTGEVLNNFEGLVESEVIPGSDLPLVMSDSILSICLGVLCNDYFIIKLCDVIPNFSFSKELERTLLSQPWCGFCEFHLQFFKIILNLHSNSFQSKLKNLSQSKTDESLSLPKSPEKKMTEQLNDLFAVVSELRSEDANEDSNLKEEMVICCIRHAVRLLDLTYLESKKGSCIEAELPSGLLKNIVKLFEQVKHLDPLKDEWVTWRAMSDIEVVQEAVVVGAVALAHAFFVTDRNWTLDDVQKKFKEESHAWVLDLISVGDLEKAKLALTNLVSC